MPSMADHPANTLVKVLCPSDSGSGKTGALASLVDAGFNVRVLDFDNGLSVLKGYVKKKDLLAKNVHYVDKLQDQIKLVGGRVGVMKAPAFQRAMDALDKGGEAYWGAPIPPLVEWTPRDVLAVDSLSMAGRASLQMVLVANGKGLGAPEIQHYGLAMENIEKWLQMLTSSAVPCNVIINTHITSVDGDARLYPEALGSKLSPKIGRYFDNVVSIRLSGGKRVFNTVKDGLLPLKTAVPLPETIPIENGWKIIFESLTGKKTEELLK